MNIANREKGLNSAGESNNLSAVQIFGVLYRLLGQIVRVICWCYAIGLGVLALGFHWIGQANLTTAALMYLPPWLWILPSLMLILATLLLLEWRGLMLIAVCVSAYVLFHMNYVINRQTRVGPSVGGAEVVIRLITWNRGQSRGVSLQPIKNEFRPDLILLQDAGRRYDAYRNQPEYTEFTDVKSVSEFTILSKWPIVSSEALGYSAPSASKISHPAAARFEIQTNDGKIVIYSIHLHSPRGALESYKHGAFIYGVLGVPGTAWAQKRRTYEVFWDLQMAIAAEIVARIQKESLPVIVAGDFNTPAFGPIYNSFSAILLDTHHEAGHGFGYTFPGNSKSIFTFRNPWLRLDQIFVSQDWDVLNSTTVQANAQHLPVLAEIRIH